MRCVNRFYVIFLILIALSSCKSAAPSNRVSGPFAQIYGRCEKDETQVDLYCTGDTATGDDAMLTDAIWQVSQTVSPVCFVGHGACYVKWAIVLPSCTSGNMDLVNFGIEAGPDNVAALYLDDGDGFLPTTCKDSGHWRIGG